MTQDGHQRGMTRLDLKGWGEGVSVEPEDLNFKTFPAKNAPPDLTGDCRTPFSKILYPPQYEIDIRKNQSLYEKQNMLHKNACNLKVSVK